MFTFARKKRKSDGALVSIKTATFFTATAPTATSSTPIVPTATTKPNSTNSQLNLNLNMIDD